MSISDHIVLMKDGVLQQYDVPQALYNNPANQFVADFLGNPPINNLHGVVKGGQFVLDNRDFLREVGNPQVLVLHPSKEWDRARLSFREAIDRYLGSGPYIAIDSRRTFAFIETESGCEGHEFLYLHP